MTTWPPITSGMPARDDHAPGTRNEFTAFQVFVRGELPVGSIEPALVFDGPLAKSVGIEFGFYRRSTPSAARSPTRSCRLRSPPPCPAARARACTSSSMSRIAWRRANTEDSELCEAVGSAQHNGWRRSRVLLPVVLRVWDFTLPDRLSFLPEMNCYGLPDDERAFYRLAHRHRTVLNRLPYFQNGRMADGCAARAGTGAASSLTGRAGIGGSDPSSMGRHSPTYPAVACRSSVSTCPSTKTGPARWKGTTTATTGRIVPSPNRIAGRSWNAPGSSRHTSRPGGGRRRSFTAFSITR